MKHQQLGNQVLVKLGAMFSCLILLTFLFVPFSSYAETVRGRLEYRLPSGIFPAPYIPVTLYNLGMGQSTPAYSGNNGMFYFYNVPPGPYDLQVWIHPSGPIVYPILVEPRPRGYFDIPAIPLPPR